MLLILEQKSFVVPFEIVGKNLANTERYSTKCCSLTSISSAVEELSPHLPKVKCSGLWLFCKNMLLILEQKSFVVPCEIVANNLANPERYPMKCCLLASSGSAVAGLSPHLSKVKGSSLRLLAKICCSS